MEGYQMAATVEVETTQTVAQVSFRKAMDLWVKNTGFEIPADVEAAVEAVQWQASSAMDRAEEVHAEHDRMIIDLQQTVIDITEGKLGGTHESVEAELYAQSQRISEMQQSIEDLMAGSAVTVDRAENTKPVITERFKHSKTAKGWRLDESSLTIDWKGGIPDSATRARLLREAYADGMLEEKIRNEEPETLAVS
jgi:hypothetical protein